MHSDYTIIPLTRNQFAIVDNIDSDLLETKWQAETHTRDGFYAERRKRIGGRKQFRIIMHRVILSRILGRELLSVELVDHVDGDGLNNRRSNLRLATHPQNMQNRKINKNNTTGYKGVFRNRKNYIARIQVNKRKISLGTYPSPELAAQAYNQAAVKYFGEFARLNDLPPKP